jgi:acyl-CoA hydrolase
VKLHGLKFAAPVKTGDIIVLETHVVHAGTTSLTSYGCVRKDGEERILVEGFATFVCVDDEGRKMPHNIVLPEPENEKEYMLRETARNLK